MKNYFLRKIILKKSGLTEKTSVDTRIPSNGKKQIKNKCRSNALSYTTFNT